MNQYQLYADEIKNKGNVLGSIGIHEEAMRRLNQSLGKNRAHPPRVSEEKMANNVLHSLGETLASPFWKDNVFTRLKVTGKHGQDACDPSKVKMAGRRTSTFKPVEFSESITASQVLHDLDLSDSDDESVDPPMPSPGQMAKGGDNSRGRCTTPMRSGDANISPPLTSAVRRRISKVFRTLYDYDDREEMKTEKHSMHDREQGEKSDKESMISWKPLRLNHESTGRRISSCFSAKERTSVNRSSGSTLLSSFCSLDNSTGSCIEDGGLICDWERHQSKLSGSSVPSIQESLLDGKEGEALGSLICGWD
jgi:hypothetical protein